MGDSDSGENTWIVGLDSQNLDDRWDGGDIQDGPRGKKKKRRRLGMEDLTQARGRTEPETTTAMLVRWCNTRGHWDMQRE